MNKLYTTYKYKLKLTANQRRKVDSWIDGCRCVYNLALETKVYAYRSHGVSLSEYDLVNQLKDLRASFDWIQQVPSESLALAISRLDKAFGKFFKGGGFPKWAKKKNEGSISFRSTRFRKGAFILTKLGRVRFFKDRHPVGKLSVSTLKKSPYGYFLTVRIEAERPINKPVNENQVIGLDMGISQIVVDSTGRATPNPRHTVRYERNLRIASRSLARKVKGSKNWQRQRVQVARVHSKIKATRNDFLQKLSTEYVQHNSAVIVEALKIKSLVLNSSLSKHIYDASWADFFKMLQYKCALRGKTFCKVPAAYTSQTCNSCGAIEATSRKSQSEFECVSCGHQDHADINAAKNIRGQGMAMIRQREAIACA